MATGSRQAWRLGGAFLFEIKNAASVLYREFWIEKPRSGEIIEANGD